MEPYKEKNKRDQMRTQGFKIKKHTGTGARQEEEVRGRDGKESKVTEAG